MAKNSNEPKKKKGEQKIDTNNLVTTRTASAGSAYEKALTPDTEGFNTPSYGSVHQQKGEEVAMTKEDAITYVMRVAGVDRNTAEALNDAVYKWTGSDYDDIRAVQQGKNNDPKFKKLGDDLETFIERTAKWGGGVTYRGISGKHSFKVGEVIDQKGTASWSTKENVARRFAGGGAIRGTVFISPTQSKGTSTKFSHQHSSEHEVTVSKKARYVVENIEQRGLLTYVWTREA